MSALDRVAPALRCPVCADPLAFDQAGAHGRLVCARGHGSDVARHGYVSLLGGRAAGGTADTAAMVAERQAFLERGHYAPISEALVAALGAGIPEGAGPAGGPLVLDLGGGTGWYAARVLEARPDALGLVLDLSAPAVRRAARAHPRLAAAVADAWRPLPLADAAAGAVLSVFGPRNPPEIARVLGPDGVLVTATPRSEHLAGLRGPLGLIDVDPEKEARLRRQLVAFEHLGAEELDWSAELDRPALSALVLMGPNAHHTSPERLSGAVERLLDGRAAVSVAFAVRVERWRPLLPGSLPRTG